MNTFNPGLSRGWWRAVACRHGAVAEFERQLDRSGAKVVLHGRTEAIEGAVKAICAKLDGLELGAGEDWLMYRERELGRTFQPLTHQK